jgi:hypothetical protein
MGCESSGRTNAARESEGRRGQNLATGVRTPRVFSDIISIGICRRRGPLWYLEGGALAAPERTR